VSPALPRIDAPLSDGEVELRSPTEHDIAELVDGLNDPEIARWTRVPAAYTREHAEAYLAEMEERRRTGRELALAVTDSRSGELIGALNLRITSWEHRRGEFAAAFFAHGRGRRLAPSAGRLLARYAFEELRLARIEAVLAVDNVAVRRATERAGFTREATLRRYVERDGERLDMVIYSLLPEDL
jgi:[ribosomal protein S5]-alanine N-acetyltransferase